MRNVARTIKFFSLLLEVSACCVGILPPPIQALAPPPQPRLRFDQSLAFSDFDGDGRFDLAQLNDAGLRKSIEIYLSHSGTRSVLQLDIESVARGSLVAADVDNDGATDLIWTDLLHADDVIIWLGDGMGRFTRICPHGYTSRFVITGSGLGLSDGPARETALICASNRSRDQVLNKGCVQRIANSIASLHQKNSQLVRGVTRQPSDRGPPK